MSEEVALAAADLALVAQLRGRILEWEDAYDRLHGAFELHMDILDCKQALSAYAGVFYDVLMGALIDERDQHKAALAVALDQIDAEHDLTKALLIKQRRYIVSHGLLMGECVAWMHLKTKYGIGEITEADEQWLRAYEQRKARAE